MTDRPRSLPLTAVFAHARRYPHYVGFGREWPAPGSVAWSATHSIKWGHIRLHFNSPAELVVEFVGNGVGYQNVSGNGLPVPAPATATVEDSLRISKHPYSRADIAAE